MDVTFAQENAGDEPAAGLIVAMRDELAALYGPLTAQSPSATPEELSPARGGVCLVGYAEGAAVCVGGVKRLPGGTDTAEIKRMYVAEAARGRGVARRLLAALEAEARALGYATARLDTGPQQPHAKALYLSVGYAEIPDYNGNPYASFWGERTL